MSYPHDEAARQKRVADEAMHGAPGSDQPAADHPEGPGVRPQNTTAYPRADAPELRTEDSPEFTDRKDTGIDDRDGATRPGTSDGDVGGTS
jgi:hypothetical protein